MQDGMMVDRAARLHMLTVALPGMLLASCTGTRVNAVPVQVGGEADYDACAAVGKVVMAPDSPGKVPVRIAPDLAAKVSGSVQLGEYVWMCDSAGGGAWTGILYSNREDGRIACGVSGTIENREDYSGPCHQGWVPSANIRLFAG